MSHFPLASSQRTTHELCPRCGSPEHRYARHDHGRTYWRCQGCQRVWAAGAAYHRLPRPITACLWCGDLFQRRRRRQQYCSVRCKCLAVAAHYAQSSRGKTRMAFLWRQRLQADPVRYAWAVPVPPGRWSRAFAACQACGTTERPHNARGLCHRCYARQLARRRAQQAATP